MIGHPFELRALDGTNPLGFLAALGTLVTLEQSAGMGVRLRWRLAHTWVPVLEGAAVAGERALAEVVAESLRGKPLAPGAEQDREAAQRAMRDAKTAVKKKRDEIRRRRLSRSERAEAEEREVQPMLQEYEAKRRRWLETLRCAVPRPELALGARIDCTAEEYREHAGGFLAGAGYAERDALDMLAAFGSDGCRRRNSDTIAPTPFCFTSGSGHQEFLDTARQLIDKVTPGRVHETLFEPWSYRDEKFSMRWDPAEDRRYALLDHDPSEDSTRTVWMANLLAYRALALFPTTPTGRGLVATGWYDEGEGRDRREFFTWPLWEYPATLDSVRTVLQLPELMQERPDGSLLRARGIAAVYRVQRITVGDGPNKKVNFTPARRV